MKRGSCLLWLTMILIVAQAQSIIYEAVPINGVYYNLLSDGTAEVTNSRGGDSDGENCYSGGDYYFAFGFL